MSPTVRSAATLALLALAGLAAARVARAMTAGSAPRGPLPSPTPPRAVSPAPSGPAAGGSAAAAYSTATLRDVGATGPGTVRNAGPEAMRDPPRRDWDRTDEASDESFPASDPPATY